MRAGPCNGTKCVCGERYEKFRTGETFASVRRMMRNLPDPNRPGWFRQKRRRCVLGYWHELKQRMWTMRHGWCEAAANEAA